MPDPVDNHPTPPAGYDEDVGQYVRSVGPEVLAASATIGTTAETYPVNDLRDGRLLVEVSVESGDDLLVELLDQGGTVQASATVTSGTTATISGADLEPNNGERESATVRATATVTSSVATITGL